MHYSTVALIPARAGSKRIPGKNIKTLGGHPLIAYAIQSALDAEIFGRVYVSSDSDKILEIAEHYGAKCIKRPSEYATQNSPDSEWIGHALQHIGFCHYYAIVRPTNPFRTGDMIKRAWKEWDMDSIMKAIKPVKEHPSKMWELFQNAMVSIPYDDGNEFGHLEPIQNLEICYVQCGSIEWRKRLGQSYLKYQPFFPDEHERRDLNTPYDWILAEALIEKGYAKLPTIEREPYDFTAV